ncbi:hypothetical protein B4U80_13811 [Leptotrombidium deliense]|uniref:Group XIIA secretory phospholipase A2-like protein n=1 Tax=Leptotrombidium deliense TaxID=299467 RepID=A0A443SD76_9ACAR|nr:hypothetical protein B4U80_13811 [Leptotrombidium deliense]
MINVKCIVAVLFMLSFAENAVCMQDFLSNLDLAKTMFTAFVERYSKDVSKWFSYYTSFMESLLEKIEKFVQDFIDYIRDDHCVFVCKNGKPGIKNEKFIPTTKGCGFIGIAIHKDHLPDPKMQECCHKHDLCYSECLSDKDACDTHFQSCMLDVCNNTSSSLSTATNCRVSAKMVYLMNLIFSCRLFLYAQKQACICDDRSDL